MISSKVFLEGIPAKKREQVVDALCYSYPAWFFEILVEFGDSPLVLEPFQIKILTHADDPFLIVNKSRQSGGSLIFALEQMWRAMTTYDYRCDVVSLNITEATDKIRYIRNAWETLPNRYRPKLFKDNALSIGFHDGRRSSIINSLAPTSAVRGGRKSLLLDEFAHIIPQRQIEVYRAALPATLNSVPGQELNIRIVSTPLGDSNKFAEIWYNKSDVEGRRMYDRFVREQFIWLDVRRFFEDEQTYQEVQKKWYIEYAQNLERMDELVDVYGNERIREIRASSSHEDFLQEMCGSFITYRDQFFSNTLIQKCVKGRLSLEDLKHLPIETEFTLGNIEEEQGFHVWSDGRPKNIAGEVTMGIDFGESTPDKDKTCVQVIHKDKRTGRFYQRFSYTFNGHEWGDFVKQSDAIAEIHKKYRPDKVIVDGTALGRGVSDILADKIPNMNLEEVTFHSKLKEEMFTNLRILMESDKMWIQNDDKELQRELRNIQRRETAGGNIQFRGSPHDDRVNALALAVKNTVYTPFAFYVVG